MIGWRKAIPAIVAVLTLTVGVYADMVPTSSWGDLPDGSALPETSPQTTEVEAVAPFIGPDLIDLDSRCPVVFLPEVPVSVGTDESGQTTEPVRLLDRERGSLDLCLYALMGFGLCRTAPWVRKLSFGFVPDWYHHGGPYQIGGSHAVDPDCLCTAAVCFVQPQADDDNDFSTISRVSELIALWRQSQFTPEVLAARAPPFRVL